MLAANLLQSDANRELVAAIEALADDQPLFTVFEALLRLVTTTHSIYRDIALTARERQIVQLIAEGYSNKMIAKLFNITLKTVESHRAAVSSTCHRLPHSCDYAIRNKIIERELC